MNFEDHVPVYVTIRLHYDEKNIIARFW